MVALSTPAKKENASLLQPALPKAAILKQDIVLGLRIFNAVLMALVLQVVLKENVNRRVLVVGRALLGISFPSFFDLFELMVE
jgi:hypothetical protein